MANTTILERIKSSGRFASVDAKWGPYTSVAAAHAKLGEDGDDVAVIGLTVGVIEGNKIVEYWYQGGTALSNLTRKTVSVDGELSPSSDNPVANEVLYEGFDNLGKDVTVVTAVGTEVTGGNKANLTAPSDYSAGTIFHVNSGVDGPNYRRFVDGILSYVALAAGRSGDSLEDNTKFYSTYSSTDALSKRVDLLNAGKVDTVPGKGLSTNDYTNEEKAKVGTLVTNVDTLNATMYGGGSSLRDDENTIVENYSSNGGHPATNTGKKRVAGYYRNYTVNLTQAFKQGYTTVRFYAMTYTKDSDIVAGLIAEGEDGNGDWIVESGNNFVPNTKSYQYGYFELPITPNSKLLVATVLTPYGVDNIGSYYEGCPDASFVPETVELLGPKSQSGIVLEISQMKATLDDITPSGTLSFPDTYLPAKVYGVIGNTLQIFRRSVVVSNDPYRNYLDFVCGQGKVYERYLEITPEKVGGEVPTGLTVKHRLIDDKFNKSEEVTSELVLADRPSGPPASNINVLCIGASTTASGQWPSELKRRLTGTRGNGTPAADGLRNITFVGRKELAAANGVRPVAVNVEATGGWRWKSFYTPQAAVRFTVSGVTSVDVGTVYSYTNGNGQLVKVSVAEVNITSGSGNIRFIYSYDTVGRGLPATASGTLTRVSTSGGDATIAYSGAEEETYCPFYDEQNEVPDFAHYASLYCNNQIDVLIAYMGNVNEGITGDSTDAQIATRISEMKTLLDAFHTDFPNGKVIIGIAALANPWYGYEYNYSAASPFKTWSMRYGLYRYAKAIEAFLQGDDYKDWCYLANTHTEVDSENGYPTSTKSVNARSSKTEEIGTNGAHPTLEGYQMIADSFYRCFANVVTFGSPVQASQFGDTLPFVLGGGSGRQSTQLGEELPITLS